MAPENFPKGTIDPALLEEPEPGFFRELGEALVDWWKDHRAFVLIFLCCSLLVGAARGACQAARAMPSALSISSRSSLPAPFHVVPRGRPKEAT